MDPKTLVLRCALLLSGTAGTKRPMKLTDLKLTQHQLTELQAISCDELILLGYSRVRAFRDVQKAMAQLV